MTKLFYEGHDVHTGSGTRLLHQHCTFLLHDTTTDQHEAHELSSGIGTSTRSNHTEESHREKRVK